MAFTYTPISRYSKSRFAAPSAAGHRITHDVYTQGEGPPIILIQELPGIGRETLRLADRLSDAGFQLVLPHLFGRLESTNAAGNLARVICLRKEFRLFESNRSSPVVDWLKALCGKVRTDADASGVGVIGMCLTGNFAISLMGDDNVVAAVASQPAMPFHRQNALHMSEQDVAAAVHGIDQTGPMQSYRFQGDWMCSAAKFDCLDKTFNTNGKERVQLNTLPGKGHSVFTLDFVDVEGHPTHQALQSVIAYFRSQLLPAVK